MSFSSNNYSPSNRSIPCISTIRKLSASKYPVYLGHDTSGNKKIALKAFPVDHPEYEREKSFLTALRHPHIIELCEAIDTAIDSEGEQNSYLGLEYAVYGDLVDVILTYGKIGEALTRTLFHQLIDVLEYMHGQNIAHMDLKVDNILLNESFELKVADFDLSQYINSIKIVQRGTPGYRAPEVKDGTCQNLPAADVYSAGIVLFVMMSGNPPYIEVSRGYQLEFDKMYKAMRDNVRAFWTTHSRHRGNPNFYSVEFMDLFMSMVEEDPERRATIEDIKASRWYNGPVLDSQTYKLEMQKYMKQI